MSTIDGTTATGKQCGTDRPFFPLIPDVYIMTSITGNKSGKMKALSEFMTAQYNKLDFCDAFTSVGEVNTHFSVKRYGALFPVFFFKNSSQQLVRATFCARFQHLYH